MATNLTEIKTQLKYLRIPARKVRFVAEVVKGLPVDEAEAKLTIASRRPKDPILKLIRSAVSNAKTNHKIDPEKLYIKNITVDQGPMFKRWMTRSRGGVDMIQKKTSHITLTLGISDKNPKRRFAIIKPEKEKKEEKPSKKEEKENKSKTEVIKEMKETNEIKPAKEPGSFNKVFRRKAI